jgi:hypothetical protein
MMKSIAVSSPDRWTFFDHASPHCAAGKKLALRAQTIFPAGASLREHGTRKISNATFANTQRRFCGEMGKIGAEPPCPKKSPNRPFRRRISTIGGRKKERNKEYGH